MLIKTISNEVTQTVTLGGGAYAAHLTVTATGKVQPNAYAATGIYAALASARLLNQGSIYGGYRGMAVIVVRLARPALALILPTAAN
jgi:hypothetical protein